MLSMSAAMDTKGNSFVPPPEMFQITCEAVGLDFKNRIKLKLIAAKVISIKNLLNDLFIIHILSI